MKPSMMKKSDHFLPYLDHDICQGCREHLSDDVVLMTPGDGDGRRGGDQVALMSAFAEMGLKLRVDMPQQSLDIASIFFHQSTTATEAKENIKALNEQRERNTKALQENMKLNKKEVKHFNSVDAFPGDAIIFMRVLNLLRGLSASLNVRIVYLDIMRPFAESNLLGSMTRSPSTNSEWIYDSPVNSEVESKLRNLLIEMGSDKFLILQVHHLLNHTSGLHNTLGDVIKTDPLLVCDWEEMLDQIAKSTHETEPGSSQIYHYLSFGWLCGGPIEDVVEERQVKEHPGPGADERALGPQPHDLSAPATGPGFLLFLPLHRPPVVVPQLANPHAPPSSPETARGPDPTRTPRRLPKTENAHKTDNVMPEFQSGEIRRRKSIGPLHTIGIDLAKRMVFDKKSKQAAYEGDKEDKKQRSSSQDRMVFDKKSKQAAYEGDKEDKKQRSSSQDRMVFDKKFKQAAYEVNQAPSPQPPSPALAPAPVAGARPSRSRSPLLAALPAARARPGRRCSPHSRPLLAACRRAPSRPLLATACRRPRHRLPPRSQPPALAPAAAARRAAARCSPPAADAPTSPHQWDALFV
ncbi:hypothetical protein D1007_18186 [Hordeum vulgare]|nr:hypothetical protein D1007_18186 [Hordeum vulgare]